MTSPNHATNIPNLVLLQGHANAARPNAILQLLKVKMGGFEKVWLGFVDVLICPNFEGWDDDLRIFSLICK